MIGYHNFRYAEPEYFERQQPYHTFHYIISGKGTLKLNGKYFHVKSNEIFYLDNQNTFCYYPDGDEPWEYVFFELHSELASNYAKFLGFSKNAPVKTCTQKDKIMSLLAEIFADGNENRPSYFLVQSFLYALLDSAYTGETPVHYSQSQKTLNDIKDLIELKYSQTSLDLSFICKAIHISHSHLCRIFKQKEGITPIQYINEVKIKHAKEQLLNTDKSVYEISINVGYNEYSHFLKLFKKLNGLTPSKFRELYTPPKET